MDGVQYVKVKGVKNVPTLSQLEDALNLNTPKLELSQEKWFKSINEGNIKVKESPYQLNLAPSKIRDLFSDDKLN